MYRNDTSSPRAALLCLAAAFAVVSACAGPDPLAATDPGVTETTEANLTCGGLAPGEAVGRGQSIRSCNGRATLAHQTDGNIVIYDQAGAAWSSATSGHSDTTWFVMQTDGNLVLYSNSGALWSSGTAGHPNSRFALQDDCNAVIYDSSNRVLWATYTFCRINMLDYMVNTGGALRDTTYGDAQQTRWDQAGKKFWYLKNPGDSTRWERYGYDNNQIWLERDTTLPVGDGPGSAYDNVAFNSLSFPRVWKPGTTSNFSTTHYYFTYQSSCSYNSNKTPWPDGRHTFRYLGPWNLGGSLGTVDVVIMDRYHDLNVNPYNPRGAERFWYAKGRGWVRWEMWTDRTKDTRWNSGSATDIANTTPTQRRTFNSSTSALGFTDVCTALHP